ncbi:hypothetical protein GCM10017744_092240 [Streptomyces antimycoticus]
MQAAELFEQSIKSLEMARRLRVHGKSVYQWHQLWRAGGAGAQALVSCGPSGSRCRLSPRCLEMLVAYLEQGPAAHGWVEDQVWTASRVATLIDRKVSCLLQRLRRDEADAPAWFQPTGPARRVAERDERARHHVEGGDLGRGNKEPGRLARAASASRTRQASPADRPGDAPGADATAPLS